MFAVIFLKNFKVPAQPWFHLRGDYGKVLALLLLLLLCLPSPASASAAEAGRSGDHKLVYFLLLASHLPSIYVQETVLAQKPRCAGGGRFQEREIRASHISRRPAIPGYLR